MLKIIFFSVKLYLYAKISVVRIMAESEKTMQKNIPLPKLSIIMPSFNSGRFIREAIDSVLSQDYPWLELIVMDGGSTDGTITILESYGNKIRWSSGKDRGQGHALNKGFAIASGEILGWLNADDLYEPGCLLAMGNFFNQHPEIFWASGYCSIIDESGKEIRKFITRYKTWRLRHYRYNHLLTENFLPQMGIFFRKSALAWAGQIDETLYYAMDYDLWLRLGKIEDPGFINQKIGKFRMYSTTKTMSGYRKGFQEDFSVSKRYSRQKPWLIPLHRLNNLKIVAIYTLLNFFSVLKIKKP